MRVPIVTAIPRELRAMNQPDAAQEREDPTKNVTCESALRELGIDEAVIARKLKDLLEAKYRRWNPKKEKWEAFDDCNTQLAAIKEIVKIFGGYPSESKDNEAPMIIDISAIPMRRERSDDREHCQEDPNASGTVSEE